jgi:hypothetical protein
MARFSGKSPTADHRCRPPPSCPKKNGGALSTICEPSADNREHCSSSYLYEIPNHSHRHAPAPRAREGKQVVSSTSSQAAIDELREEVETLKTQVKETFPGTTKFLLTGYGTAGLPTNKV